MKYSSALTSWFVIFSICFISTAYSVVKFSYNFLSFLKLFGSKSISSGSFNSQSAIKYSISTSKRYLISASSEKKAEKIFVFAR